MDTTTLLLIVSLLLAVVGGAVKFMRLVGLIASRGRSARMPHRGYDDRMSFDERLAQRLSELERDPR